MKHGYFFSDEHIHLFNDSGRRMCDGKRIDDHFIDTEASVSCQECKRQSKGFAHPTWMIDELIDSTSKLIDAIKSSASFDNPNAGDV